VLVVLAFVYVALSRRTLTRHDVLNLALVGLLALLVFAPLGVYFITHPGSFSQRIGQAATVGEAQGLAGSLQALGQGALDTLLLFGFRGEDFPLYSLSGRPALSPFLFLLFLAGLVVCLLRFRKSAYLFLITWLVVMSIPALLSQYGPAAKRAIGALPAAMVLIAMGVLVPWERADRWVQRHRPRWARGLWVLFLVVVVLGFVYSAARTYRDYFVLWADDPDLFTHYEVGITSIGQYAASLPPQEAVYVSPVAPDHPGIVYNSQGRAGIKGYDGRFCIVVPQQAPADITYVIVPNEDKDSLDLLHTYYTRGEIVAEGPLHYGQPYYLAYRVPRGTPAAISPSVPLAATWGDRIGLLGYDLDAQVYEPGNTIQLVLYYQALAPMERDYTAFTQLLGSHNPATGGPLWGQSDSQPCQGTHATSAWTPGEIVRDRLTIPIPSDAPPGQYQLTTGFYLLETLERLPAAGAEGNPIPDDAVRLITIEIRE
jgi:hypothetical protein